MGLTGKDISANTDFRGQLNVGEKECAKELGKRTFPEPGVDRVEHEFVTSVSVSVALSARNIATSVADSLFPSIKLVEH